MSNLDAHTPAQLDYRMPAEWEPHEATWIAWPHNRNPLGHAPTTGTDGGNEAPRASWQVKTWPGSPHFGTKVSHWPGYFFPQAPHLAQAMVLVKLSKKRI